jgi:energy-coupling factor transporter ATP-binding protein EcfA2
MRTIDIFVSAPADVQKEHAIAEQAIRSVAVEFNLPINICYSNPLRGSNAENGNVGRTDFGDQSPPVLCPYFWEYPESEADDLVEQVPDGSQYHLAICIIWSQLGPPLSQACFMPDGSRPRSATDYEVAWALEQGKHTPGRPRLHVYRNRATPAAPLEPKEQRENSFRQWDAVQEFCAAWEKDAGTGFRECCHDFQDLEEFENLFREHFRDFLAWRLDPEIVSDTASRKVRHLGPNPFRGLNLFDFEHSALYHGRTRAVGEVLDVVKKQVAAKKPFLLVMGPNGSGKSSLVRAGLVPLVIRGGTSAGPGPWRRAVTQPGADPFDALATALIAKFALPELHEAASPEKSRDLAFQLTTDPAGVAARIVKMMDQLGRQELDHLRANRTAEALPAKDRENVEIASRTSLPQGITQLALVVDQLEELFTRFSPVLQQKYIAALCALANCERVFIIATLRSDFYPHYQRSSELTAFGGRYDLQPPTPRGIRNMIRFPADAAGLRLERDPETGRSLEETILKAAVANPEPLPLLEHLLSRLYQRQLARKDGLLLWSDYQSLGGFQEALAQHAEFVFLNSKSDEQQALKFVIRNLLVPSGGEGGFLSRRSVPYPALISSSQLNERQRAGTKGLVDRLIKEGLLSVEIEPQQQGLIRIPQEALLRRWPRLSELLSEDRRFLRMRDRLDANLKLWISRGRQREDLLDRGISLAEARTLLTDFGSQLNEGQIDYIQRSLARHKPSRKVPQKIGLAAIVCLAISAAFVGGERFNASSKRPNNEQDVRVKQQNADLAASQRSELEAERGGLEIRLKETEQKLGIAQQSAEFANGQRSALEAELKKAQDEKAQLPQQNTNLDPNQRSELEAQLKKAEEKLLLAQQNADLANSQRSALEAELEKAREEKGQLAQQNTNLAADQRSELEAQLKKAGEELLLAQQNADIANSQRSALEAELKKSQEEKAQLVQQNTNLVASQHSEQEDQHSLEAQLKTAEEKLLLAQQDADLANSQRSALEAELKKAQEEKVQANANSQPSQFQGLPPDTFTSRSGIDSEEIQVGLQRRKYALLNPPQVVSPTPSPSPAKQSETPEPQQSQSGRSEATGEKESLKQFVLGYLGTVASNNTSLQRPYLGERVNFYGKGVLNSSDISFSPKGYHKWPIRKCEPRGEAKVVQWRTPNMFSVYQPFTWTAADGSHHAHGNSTLYLRVRKNSLGEFQIVYVRQLNR